MLYSGITKVPLDISMTRRISWWDPNLSKVLIDGAIYFVALQARVLGFLVLVDQMYLFLPTYKTPAIWFYFGCVSVFNQKQK